MPTLKKFRLKEEQEKAQSSRQEGEEGEQLAAQPQEDAALEEVDREGLEMSAVDDENAGDDVGETGDQAEENAAGASGGTVEDNGDKAHDGDTGRDGEKSERYVWFVDLLFHI